MVTDDLGINEPDLGVILRPRLLETILKLSTDGHSFFEGLEALKTLSEGTVCPHRVIRLTTG
jgi:hypothetical protein